VGAFGDKFRRERERRGFTLDDVSNVTKINARMLKAIEEEHFDLLPGGVFNKGFVRAYAKHLGFNDEESITEYLAALRQAQVEAQSAAWQPEVPPQVPAQQVRAEKIRVEQRGVPPIQAEKVLIPPRPNPPAVPVGPKVTAEEARRGIKQTVKAEVKPEIRPEPSPAPMARKAQGKPQPYSAAQLDLPQVTPRADSIPWKVPAAVLAVILLAAVLWNRHSRGVQAESAASAHVPESRVAAANTSALTTPANVAAATQTSSAAKRSSNSAPPSSSQLAANRGLGSNPALAAEHAASDHAITDRATTDQRAADQAVTVRKLHGAAATSKAPPPFTLRIRASETTWISVTADGQPTTQETLIAPAGTSIRATREITVRVGNAAGVSFLLNGKEIPPQGSEGEVKTLTFDGKGVKEATHDSAPDAAR
jgi:cytoskeletal protein RodZ